MPPHPSGLVLLHGKYDFKLGRAADIGPLGYYWRDYTGKIPEDAFPGGHDSKGNPTYIGQAYLTGAGIIPTNVYRGQSAMYLPAGWEANYSDFAMKILCTSNPKSLSWINVTPSDLHSVTAGKELVIGGYHPHNGGKTLLNVGRVRHEGELIVGKIHGIPGKADMFFVGGVLITKTDKATSKTPVSGQDPENRTDLGLFEASSWVVGRCMYVFILVCTAVMTHWPGGAAFADEKPGSGSRDGPPRKPSKRCS
ncbi:hypothetical protein Zmor_026001 [Zophobas morio]|uniref:Uncharacterized protein n=1 Tax=Zophobas morio TaxID=2755281 RepID=A0AA38HT72_9CUCU|nr:hypothetical protein Zmor_026001 [Zophobas morio]